MKVNRVFLVLGFVLITELHSDAQPFSSQLYGGCCFNFFSGKIPYEEIQKIVKTGSHCSQKGFIVTTSKFEKLCVHEALFPLPHGDCCFKFFSGEIPDEEIQKLVKTGSHCSQKGFIVTTPKFEKLCVHKGWLHHCG